MKGVFIILFLDEIQQKIDRDSYSDVSYLKDGNLSHFTRLQSEPCT